MACKYRRYCSVYGCINSSLSNPALSFFTLPREKERQLQWLQLIAREDLMTKHSAKCYVCEIHFNTQDICKRSVRKVLKKNCYPCLQLPNPTKQDEQIQDDIKISEDSDQTEIGDVLEIEFDLMTSCSSDPTVKISTSGSINPTAVALSADATRKRKLNSELLGSEKRLKLQEPDLTSQKDIFYKLCDRLLSKDLAELVKVQTSSCILKPGHEGNTYSNAYKMFCLNLYYISPQAYHLLKDTLALPCRSTLNNLYIPTTTEVNDELMAVLKMKVNHMSESEKQCSLVIGTMRLKTNLFYDIKNDKIIGFQEVQGIQSPTPANYALVVLLRGIFVKWHQPIGFALLSECSSDDKISLWIDKIISKLFEIGLKVRVCVSDLGSGLLKASKKRGISLNKTYFSKDNHKIYYIFDTPHLIKLIRNNLMTYNFHFQDGSVAEYKHIVQFYEQDHKKDYRLAHKLTNSHIRPNNFEKLKVCYATQLLSRSVASGLSAYIGFKVIDESARATVKLIQMINDLFDVLNSSTYSDSYLYKSAFSGTEHQKDFLNKMLTFFKTLKLSDPKNGKDITKNVKFINGFEITIQSILQLHEDFKQEGYPYLLTRHLNQDIMENFFGKIRSKNGIATVPTSRQLIFAFRKICFANLTRAPKNANCAEDLTKFLIHLRDHKTDENAMKESDNVPAVSNNDQAIENTLHEILRSDYIHLDIPEKKSFIYVSGAVLKKCLDRHDCKLLTSYLVANKRARTYKDDTTDRNSLVVPPDDFVKNIKRMEQIFRKSFEEEPLNCKIGMSIYEKLKNVEFSLPCPCFPKSFSQKLFVRMMMYFTLTSNNKAFRTSRRKT